MTRRPDADRGRGGRCARLVVAAAVLATSGACTTDARLPPTLPPTSATVADPVATAADVPHDRPPDVALAADGGDQVTGQLGSYLWADGGSDSPWLAGAPIAVGAGEPLTGVVLGGQRIGSWRARRVPAASASGAGGVTVGEGGGRIAFAAPPPGAWTVVIDVQYLDGGTATYAWLVTTS